MAEGYFDWQRAVEVICFESLAKLLLQLYQFSFGRPISLFR